MIRSADRTRILSEMLAAKQVDVRRVGLAMLAFFVVQGAWIAWIFSHRGPLP